MDEVSELHSDNPAGDDCRPLAGAGLASGFMVYLKVRNRNKTFFAISEKTRGQETSKQNKGIQIRHSIYEFSRRRWMECSNQIPQVVSGH